MESLWAMLARWQYVNRVPYATLATVALAPPPADSATGADLRTLAGFELDSLSHHTGLARRASRAALAVVGSTRPC
jgi:hypothetical protein